MKSRATEVGHLPRTAPMPEVGEPAPDFTLPTTAGEINLHAFNKGRKVILAFYVEDRTPG